MDVTPAPWAHFFLHKWQLKLLALAGAIIIWLCVNQTITATKTLMNVPVRLVNVPAERTIEGILPNGFLKKRIALTLTGAKDAIDSLEDSDLEVVVDVSQFPEQSNLEVTKKNLMSLDPGVDLIRHITQVESSDVKIQLIKLVTEKVPIVITAPIGEPPENYQFLDIWPQTLYQTVTASESEMRELQTLGLRFMIDLSRVAQADLDQLPGSGEAFRGDEVIFPVPLSWKKVVIPCRGSEEVMMNDPLHKELVIRFLRKEQVALGVGIPIQVYYPAIHSQRFNPERAPLITEGQFVQVEGMTLLPDSLLSGEVSRWFIDVVRDRLAIVVVADPAKHGQPLTWGIEVVSPTQLEDAFVLFLMNDREAGREEWMGDPKKKELRLRRRFRQYVHRIKLYHANGKPLQLDCRLLQEGKPSVVVRDITER